MGLLRLISHLRWVGAAGLVAGVLACTSPLHRAPVEDRVVGQRAPQPYTAAPTATLATTPPDSPVPSTAGGNSSGVGSNGEPRGNPVGVSGAENAGKPGYYVVKTGDTLLRVSLETGHNWRDIQKWNNLSDGQVLEIGQVLRVVPPGQDPNTVVTRPVTAPAPTPIRTAPSDSKVPLTPPPAVGAAGSAGAAVAGSAVAGAVTAAAAPTSARDAPPAAGGSDEDVPWMWPAAGPVIGTFDEARAAKGMLLGGNAGDPVWASADGQVVYAGSGLLRYGNLVIIKHNNTYLTAYAHNRALLVKEDQIVKRGQKIAEMGSSDAPRVQLHFEVRRLGKPIDPSRVLPPR